MTKGKPGPAALVLAEAASRNAALGHENLGPLSESHGFLSRRPPQHDLPPPHDAWVEAVDELPDLCSSLRIRRRLEELPALDASAEALEDRHLLRAASVLGLLAHAYSNVPMRAPEELPQALVRPWLETAERLGRPAFTLSNSDYIFDNWRLVDPQATDPMRVENLRVLNAIWDHPQMDTFILVLVELLARSAPLVGAAARAQDACLRGDDDGLKAELALMSETVRRLTRESLTKISANARAGPRRVDPVLWTKLFAMLPLPVRGAPEDVRNASGAETPYFHLLDVVLGRRVYETQLGHEAMQFRHSHPPHWREFIAAVGQEPIADYVSARGDRELSGLFAELADAYHGRHGLLARHRLKAFAYMEASFKTGRSSTVTGFSGLFEDRTWEKVDASFEAARLERARSGPPTWRLARVAAVEQLCPGVQRIELDVRGLGFRCQPGDRCAVGTGTGTEDPRLLPVSSITTTGPAADRIELTVVQGAYGSDTVRPGDELPVTFVSPAGFSLPSDPSVPIVMLAEGIGIAPFVAFLEARALTPGTQNLLFAGAREDGQLPHRQRLLDHRTCNAVELHLARRADDLLRDPATIARIHELVRAGASVYVCGYAEFARSTLSAIGDAVGAETLEDLVVQHRYLQEVLPTQTVPRAQIDASELAQHNDPADGIWAVIGGRAYDLTAFAEIHPGGQKLIHSFAGMDATASYRIVEHHRDPSVNGLLSLYEVGAMRRLKLEDASLEALFRRWVNSLYALVEIENAHRLDTSIQGEPLRRSEPREARATPYRLQFGLEAHLRFLVQTLGIVCRRFGELWQATSGPCSASEGPNALDAELERILDGPEARAARARCDELEHMLGQEGATAELDALLTEQRTAERAFLRAAKTLVASGVRAFERHEAGVLTDGCETLLGALWGLPPLARAHLEAAATPAPVSRRYVEPYRRSS